MLLESDWKYFDKLLIVSTKERISQLSVDTLLFFPNGKILHCALQALDHGCFSLNITEKEKQEWFQE